ncbi:MAG: Fe-S cluster assembly ATPase SufC [Ruminococcus sp.]|nr:Fe-S cluster assembly ATPase SufC [Ruminococcus sp.]MBQ3937627.1 Fe-S cluster assembly ATPase SufC [Ruminococcus sp.]
MSHLLTITDLCVNAQDKAVLHGVDLAVEQGSTNVLMGPNGAGKSTLGLTVMGSPEYTVTGGKIIFDGQDITNESAYERAKRGIFLSFQNPVEIPGITLSEFLRNSLEQISGKHMKLWDFKKKLKEAMDTLNMDPSYADRDLNVGFSGGEKKKSEILQLLILQPKLAILDETDSGLDVDAVKTVSQGISEYKERTGGTLLIITHNTKILDSLTVDTTHILADGKIAAQGGPELAYDVIENGFDRYIGRE